MFFAATVVSTIITYFLIPETTQLSLEEIGGLFGDEVVTHMTADGHGLVEGEDLIYHDGVKVEHVDPEKVVAPQTMSNIAEA